MDGDARTDELIASVCAGPPPRKRPYPYGDGEVQGVGDGDGNNPASRRQRSSALPRLSLLANCALDLGDRANSQNELGGRNQPPQFPPDSIGGATRHPQQYSLQNNQNHMLQQTGHAQNLQGGTLPSGCSIQNTNQSTNQEILRMQQNMNMLTSQYFALMQNPSVGTSGSLLRPFGMTPQELLNYAVVINKLHESNAQGGNPAVSNLASNFLQAMVQQHSTVPTHGVQQHSAVLAHGNSNTNHSAATAAATAPNPLTGTQQQGDNGYRQLATPHQSQATSSLKNNGVQDGSNNNENCGGSGDGDGTAVANGAYAANRNDNMVRFNPVHANTQPVTERNDTVAALPTHMPQTRQDVPTRSVPLWTHEDEHRLSTQQCWLRRQIEIFPASARDVRTRGRNRLLDLGQLGIQCIHCKSLPQGGRGTGSSYFPAAIKSIYQSAQNMLTFHFKEDTCPLIPRRLLQQMRDAGDTMVSGPRMAPKSGKSRAGGGKDLWATAAKTATGLVDTTVGIRYSDDVQNYRSLESIALGTAEGEADRSNAADGFQADGATLTRVEDREKVTDFCYILMSQFFPKNLSTSSGGDGPNGGGDAWDSENEEALPSIGLCCQHCGGVSHDGKQSKGVFLSSKADTMMRNKNMARMYNHLLACAPDDIRTKLMRAKNIHLPQSDRLKKGWKKKFFENVCNRMHESL